MITLGIGQSDELSRELKERHTTRATDIGPFTGKELAEQVFGVTLSNARLGSKQLLEAFSSMPWLRAVAGKVSWAVATTQWCLYVATEKPDEARARGLARPRAIRRADIQRCMDHKARRALLRSLRDDDALREITSHPLLDVLDFGNPKFPGVIVKQLTQQHLDLVGEGMWILDVNGVNLPTAIYPIPPTWVVEMPRAERPQYVITAPWGTLNVSSDQCIFFRHPRPDDPYDRSTGIGHSLGDELETDEYAARHLKNWFRNRARPDVLITLPGARREELDKLIEQWIGKLGGVQGVNKPHFINREAKVDVISQTFAEMQLSELRKDERDTIIHVWGVPPEVFGIIENSNRSTIDASDYLFNAGVVVPRLEFQRIMLQLHLAQRYDERLILDYISPVKEDQEFGLKAMEKTPWAFDVDEHRAMAGKPPKKDGTGKLHVVPFNVTAVESLNDLTELPAPAPKPGAPVPPADDDEEDDEA